MGVRCEQWFGYAVGYFIGTGPSVSGGAQRSYLRVAEHIVLVMKLRLRHATLTVSVPPISGHYPDIPSFVPTVDVPSHPGPLKSL